MFIEILSLDSNAASNQESLLNLQRHWLNLGHALTGAEQVYEFTDSFSDDVCTTMPENPCIGASLSIFCLPNPAYFACRIIKLTTKAIAFGVLVGVTIAYQAVDRVYDIATLGEHLCCSMNHISITIIFLVKLNAFLYHM